MQNRTLDGILEAADAALNQACHAYEQAFSACEAAEDAYEAVDAALDKALIARSAMRTTRTAATAAWSKARAVRDQLDAACHQTLTAYDQKEVS